jgi:glycosyltransferase involved in cell wall biosynthesis
VVDSSDAAYEPPPEQADKARIIRLDHPGTGPYNKSRALNAGIRAALGEVLTFLDADMLAGPQWYQGATETDWRTYHRLCYRVRRLPLGWQPISIHADFLLYDRYPIAWEAWGRFDKRRIAPKPLPDPSDKRPEHQPWGNSQWTTHRRHLNGLLYDEDFAGRGFEDLDLLRRFSAAHPGYRARIETQGLRALLHQPHGYTADWASDAITRQNLAIYRARRR